MIPVVQCSGLGDTCHLLCLLCVLYSQNLFYFPEKSTQEKLPEKKNGLATISKWVKLICGLFVSTSMHVSSYLFTGVTCEAGTAYPSGSPELTPGF